MRGHERQCAVLWTRPLNLQADPLAVGGPRVRAFRHQAGELQLLADRGDGCKPDRVPRRCLRACRGNKPLPQLGAHALAEQAGLAQRGLRRLLLPPLHPERFKRREVGVLERHHKRGGSLD